MADLGGRPTVMTKEMMDEICIRIAGGEPLLQICHNENMPARSTVLLAVVDDRDGFRTLYMRAREAAGFSNADKVIDVVNKIESASIEPQQGKAMMDGLKWAAERMAQKYHGSTQKIDHTSSDKSMSPKSVSSDIVSALVDKLVD